VNVGCLALNASYEPLTLVPMRRALRLLLDGKAEIVESDDGKVVRSEKLSFPRPVVIRLTKFVHVPRRFRRQVTNTFLFARDQYRCQYCGRTQVDLKPREQLTRDHLIPISRGGLNEWNNVVTACSPCNTRKANRLPVTCFHNIDLVPGVSVLVAQINQGDGLNAEQVQASKVFETGNPSSCCQSARGRSQASSSLHAITH
jgi:5-methylcytosine-specific restriction endonuclease McrA